MTVIKISTYHIKTGKIRNNTQFRIIQVSDLHKKQFGKNNIILSNKIKDLCPDIIFMTGDMISRDIKSLDGIKCLINELQDTAPIYYSLGNHETDLKTINPSMYNELIEFIQEKCTLLDNDTHFLYRDENALKISGLTIYPECYKKNGKYKNLRKINGEDVKAFLNTSMSETCVNIILAHNPIFLDAYVEYNADLVVSGHMHGGCIRLPFIGGLLSPERKLFPKYCYGLYIKHNTAMVISSGLGKFRLFNSPEINIINIL